MIKKQFIEMTIRQKQSSSSQLLTTILLHVELRG